MADLFGLPIGTQCGDFIACGSLGPFGNGFAAEAGTLKIGLPICVAQPELCVAGAIAITIGVIGYEGYQLYKMSKGGKQNIVPSWAEGARPNVGESASQFADRLCKQQYPPDGAACGSGPGSERSKIQKWARDKFGI